MVSGHFRAPELLLGMREYGGGVDIWAMGCLFGQLLQREILFPGENELDQLQKIIALMGQPTAEEWPEYDALYGKAFRRRPPADVSSDAPTSEDPSQQCDEFGAVVDSVLSRALSSSTTTNSDSTASSVSTSESERVKQLQRYVVLRKKFSRYGFTGNRKASTIAANRLPVTHKITALSDAGFDLLCKCLAANPAHRISAAEALRHEWFSSGEAPQRLGQSLIQHLKSRHAMKVQMDKANKIAGKLTVQQPQFSFRSGFGVPHGMPPLRIQTPTLIPGVGLRSPGGAVTIAHQQRAAVRAAAAAAAAQLSRR